MAKLLLSGYYGFGNLGDEAILASTIEGVGRRDPSIEISVLSANPPETAKSHGVKAFNRMSLRQVTAAMKSSDLVVFGGGSLLQDLSSFRSLAYYLAIIFLARTLSKPLVVYANGIGPLKSPIGKRLTRAALSTARAITLRDPESKELLRDIGLNKQAKLTADPAFLLTPASPSRVQEILNREGIEDGDRVVWLALRGGQRVDFYKGFVRVVDFLKTQGYQPALLAMQERDLGVSRELNESLQSQGFKPLPLIRDLLPSEALGLLERGEFCFGMRLHTLILSAHAGVPFIGVEIDPKIGAFCRMVGNPAMPDPRVGQTLDLLVAVREFISKRGDYETALKERLPDLRSRAEENIDMILQALTHRRV